MKINTKTTQALRVRSAIKAGGVGINHNQSQQRPGLPVKTAVKGGALVPNHNQTQQSSGMKMKTKLKAGPALTVNHNESVA